MSVEVHSFRTVTTGRVPASLHTVTETLWCMCLKSLISYGMMFNVRPINLIYCDLVSGIYSSSFPIYQNNFAGKMTLKQKAGHHFITSSHKTLCRWNHTLSFLPIRFTYQICFQSTVTWAHTHDLCTYGRRVWSVSLFFMALHRHCYHLNT